MAVENALPFVQEVVLRQIIRWVARFAKGSVEGTKGTSPLARHALDHVVLVMVVNIVEQPVPRIAADIGALVVEVEDIPIIAAMSCWVCGRILRAQIRILQASMHLI